MRVLEKFLDGIRFGGDPPQLFFRDGSRSSLNFMRRIDMQMPVKEMQEHQRKGGNVYGTKGSPS
ncbi:hypothetical protein HMPREF1545_04177 [Oscillibacter sp. KLE 1728]|nr:hypothetical protein HMPREF1545_04177 [Oscillibacter sp. KLE 1728]ERK66571.1 hypothetical protein HMPREF1546_00768 [Oscillibacter sp. KLE 1745]